MRWPPQLSRRLAKRNLVHCDGSPFHHCLQPPHVVEDSTAFTSSTWRGSIFANICWCCAWTYGCCAWRACKRQAPCVQYLHTTVALWIVNICCVHYTHKYSTYRVAHSMITFHHANTRGSIAHLCVLKSNCHPRVMSRLPLFASSLTFLLIHRHPQHFWSTMNIWDPMNDHTATISDRAAVSRWQSLWQVMSPIS